MNKPSKDLEILKNCLCNEPPLNLKKISEKTGLRRTNVRQLLYRHREFFSVVGQEEYCGRPRFLYSLVAARTPKKPNIIETIEKRIRVAETFILAETAKLIFSDDLTVTPMTYEDYE